MKKLLSLALAIAALSGTACSYVTSAQPSSQAVNGDAWYVKSMMIFSLPISNTIYYCPKDAPTHCLKAQMR